MHISEMPMFHGVNERLAATQLVKLRGFYDLLLSELT